LAQLLMTVDHFEFFGFIGKKGHIGCRAAVDLG
jgi:hypothetical protein